MTIIKDEESHSKEEFEKKQSVAGGFLHLIRPIGSIMVGCTVIVGIAVTSHDYHQVFTIRSLLGFLTGFFLSCFSMISNDIYDIGVDRINQPKRPLVIGSVSVSSAKAMTLVFLVAGLAVSAPLGMSNFSIAVVFAFIAWFYNYRGKRLGLLGNSLVAMSIAIPYIFGSVALGNYSANLGYLLALTSFLAAMGREVLKGIPDIEGDKAGGVRTVAVSYGVEKAKMLVASFFILTVASSALPVLLGLLGRSLYIYTGLICMPDVIFLYLTFRVARLRVESDALKLKSIALRGMLVGMLSYLVAGIFV